MNIREELLKQATVTMTIDVRFAETDAMGVVHHAAYIVWLEMGRVAWLQAAGVPYTEVAASGHHFAVTGIHANYRASSAFGDRLRLDTRLQKLRSRQIEFGYELYHGVSGVLLITATSEHICVDLTGRMARLPAPFMTRLEAGIVQLARTAGEL
ncbi:MAG: thioesterase family protein [Caldilineaceae bacterium]